MLEEDPRRADAGGALRPRDRDVEAFRGAVLRWARKRPGTGAFVTFGVTPDRPETGYGYLELDAARPMARPCR
jgi:mannose-1-phosphate guanylyltransferase